MIEAGLYNLLIHDAGVAALIPAQGVHFSLLPKGAQKGVVLHRVAGAPITTLDAATDLIEGRFQFDSYAPDAPAARSISRAVRRLLQNFSGTLYEGTQVQATLVNLEFDAPYEAGGQGYLFRRILDISISFVEPTN